MPKIGDKIKTEDGTEGIITHILFDEKKKRFVICFQSKGEATYFVEGDKKFKILKKK